MKTSFAFLVVILLSIGLQAQPYKKELRDLDAYFAQAMSDWNVPGMAVAIVKDGQIIFEKGYGVKSTETKEKVDQNTAFAVASNTKSMTAAALAMLVDQGRIKWDDPVQRYLPWFKLYNPYVNEHLTIRDLLCHRSGLETFSGDLLWYGSQHSRREVLERAKYLKPKYGFRAHFGYQNILFLAAGEIIPVVTGKEWEEFVKEEFIDPLEMKQTFLSTQELNRAGNVASPHNEVNDRNIPIAWVNWDNIAPAGSVITSVHDWSQWIKLQLGEGTYNDRQYWSEARTNEMWTIHTPEEISKRRKEIYPTLEFAGYGLGWQLQTHHRRKVVGHGGGYDGMISRTVMVPEEGLGAVVVTNSNSSLSYALTYRILDVMLGVRKPHDWSQTFLKLIKAGEKEEDENAINGIEKVEDTTPTHALEKYAGSYEDEMYGKIEVRLVGDQLMFQFEPTPLFRGTLRHYHYDTFVLNWGTQMMLPSGLARFELGNDGLPAGLHIDVINPDFDFTELSFSKLD